MEIPLSRFGILGVFGVLGVVTNEPALYALFALFALFASDRLISIPIDSSNTSDEN